MNKELEFEGHLFQNINNKQYTICPIKKNLSKEVRALLNNSDVIGLKLQIIEPLTKMPKPIRCCDSRDPIAFKKYTRERCRKYYLKNKDKILTKHKIYRLKNREKLLAKQRLRYKRRKKNG